MDLEDTQEFTMGPCEHPALERGVCSDCGERLVLTGQVPVAGGESE